MFLVVKRWCNSFWHVWDLLGLHSWNIDCVPASTERRTLARHTDHATWGKALKRSFSVKQGQCSLKLLLMRWSVQNKQCKAWFKIVICCWLPFSPEVGLEEGIRESQALLSGRSVITPSQELTASYYVEGQGNLFFLLNTQDSLFSLPELE